jgi:hypothetical protein
LHLSNQSYYYITFGNRTHVYSFLYNCKQEYDLFIQLLSSLNLLTQLKYSANFSYFRSLGFLHSLVRLYILYTFMFDCISLTHPGSTVYFLHSQVQLYIFYTARFDSILIVNEKRYTKIICVLSVHRLTVL